MKSTAGWFRAFTLKLLFVPIWLIHGSRLKADEHVILFSGSGVLKESGHWDITLHAWVFELEENTWLNKLGHESIGEILECFGVTEEQTRSDLFRQRLKWFLVDNERNKRLPLSIENTQTLSPRTAANGHVFFNTLLRYDSSGGLLRYHLKTPENDARIFENDIQLIPPHGLSVISDIDDTIKHSEVLNKEALLQNIFFREYEAVTGMPALYKKLSEAGCHFHYLSASPWPLYPALKPFLDQNYPKGTMTLRHFRITDRSFIRFFLSSENYKIRSIETIIQRYPEHRFILIGDSGERDPEVYADIYSRYPNNIVKVLIREVSGSDLSAERMDTLYETLPAKQLIFFNDPDKLRVSQDTVTRQ